MQSRWSKRALAMVLSLSMIFSSASISAWADENVLEEYLVEDTDEMMEEESSDTIQEESMVVSDEEEEDIIEDDVAEEECVGAAVDDYTQWKQYDLEWNASEAWPKSQFPNATMYTMKAAGCVVTSIAMLLRKYNVVTETNVSKFNPWILNENLKSANAFNSAADLYWDRVQNAYAGFVLAKNSNNTWNMSEAKNYYNSGYAVVIHVDRNGYSHYVAMNGINGSDINILDPGDSYKSKLSDYGIVKGYIAYKVENNVPNVYPEEGLYRIATKGDLTEVLNIAGNDDRSGANVQLWKTHNNNYDKFYIKKNGEKYNIISADSFKYLNVQGGIRADGTNVMVYDHDNTSAENWYFEDAGGGYVYIKSELGLYLDADAAQTANGTNVQIWSFDKSEGKKWKLQSFKIYPEEGLYRIATKGDLTEVLNISGNDDRSGANVQLWKTHNNNYDKFYIKKNGEKYNIISADSFKYLNVQGGIRADGTNVMVYDHDNTSAENWYFEDAGGGYVYIRSELGLYLDADAAQTANGTNVQTWSFDKSEGKKWKIIPVDLITPTPTPNPTGVPTPTQIPSGVPTPIPTQVPSEVPTPTPTLIPSEVPTQTPSDVPTEICKTISVIGKSGTVSADVTFDLAGCNDTEAHIYTMDGSGKKAVLTKNLIRKGYTFKGWFIKDSKTGKDKKIFAINEKILTSSANLTVMAKWQENVYTVQFKIIKPDKNAKVVKNKDLKISNQKVLYESMEVNLYDSRYLSCEGYAFVGWTDDAAAKANPIGDYKLVTNTKKLAGDTKKNNKVVLYSVWKKN